MTRFKKNVQEFAGGVRSGFSGAVRTSRRLANTASGGLLDQAIDRGRQVIGDTIGGRDFRPLTRTLGMGGAPRRPDQQQMRGASMA